MLVACEISKWFGRGGAEVIAHDIGWEQGERLRPRTAGGEQLTQAKTTIGGRDMSVDAGIGKTNPVRVGGQGITGEDRFRWKGIHQGRAKVIALDIGWELGEKLRPRTAGREQVALAKIIVGGRDMSVEVGVGKTNPARVGGLGVTGEDQLRSRGID